MTGDGMVRFSWLLLALLVSAVRVPRRARAMM
jgi:hypothetical protein